MPFFELNAIGLSFNYAIYEGALIVSVIGGNVVYVPRRIKMMCLNNDLLITLYFYLS